MIIEILIIIQTIKFVSKPKIPQNKESHLKTSLKYFRSLRSSSNSQVARKVNDHPLSLL